MSNAGFLEATPRDSTKNSFTIIDRITQAGRVFLAAAPLPFPPLASSPPTRSSTILEKWRVNFGQLDTSHPMGSLRDHTAQPGEKI